MNQWFLTRGTKGEEEAGVELENILTQMEEDDENDPEIDNDDKGDEIDLTNDMEE